MTPSEHRGKMKIAVRAAAAASRAFAEVEEGLAGVPEPATILKLRERIAELETQAKEIERRNRGQFSQLQRIRAKADAAAGIDTKGEHAGSEACDLAGRASGAEGAVDLLIAKHAGLLARLDAAAEMAAKRGRP